jgi:hypothetical protein
VLQPACRRRGHERRRLNSIISSKILSLACHSDFSSCYSASAYLVKFLSETASRVPSLATQALCSRNPGPKVLGVSLRLNLICLQTCRRTVKLTHHPCVTIASECLKTSTSAVFESKNTNSMPSIRVVRLAFQLIARHSQVLRLFCYIRAA